MSDMLIFKKENINAVIEWIKNAKKENDALSAENERLTKIHRDAVDQHNKQIGIALKSCSNLRAEIAKLREALEYYADLNIYYGCGDIGMEKPADVMVDKGDIARDALKGGE
jgi:hypothetical protein